MEWNQPLFVAFMAATVSGLLGITLMLHEIKKKLPVERDGRNHRDEHRPDDLSGKLAGVDCEVSFEYGESNVGTFDQEADEHVRGSHDE